MMHMPMTIYEYIKNKFTHTIDAEKIENNITIDDYSIYKKPYNLTTMHTNGYTHGANQSISNQSMPKRRNRAKRLNHNNHSCADYETRTNNLKYFKSASNTDIVVPDIMDVYHRIYNKTANGTDDMIPLASLIQATSNLSDESNISSVTSNELSDELLTDELSIGNIFADLSPIVYVQSTSQINDIVIDDQFNISPFAATPFAPALMPTAPAPMPTAVAPIAVDASYTNYAEYLCLADNTYSVCNAGSCSKTLLLSVEYTIHYIINCIITAGIKSQYYNNVVSDLDIFTLVRTPSMPLPKYIMRLYTYMPEQSHNMLIMALINFNRFCERTAKYNFKLTRNNYHAIIFFCYYTAHINYSDSHILQKDYIEISGIKVADFNTMHIIFLKIMNWSFHIKHEDFNSAVEDLQRYCSMQY